MDDDPIIMDFELDDEQNIEPIQCKCTGQSTDDIEIKFFDKTKVVCLNNKDDRCVINLSSFKFSEEERSLFLKGLTFCPTPGEPNIQDIKNDLRDFFRRLKLRAHYFEDDPIPEDTTHHR